MIFQECCIADVLFFITLISALFSCGLSFFVSRKSWVIYPAMAKSFLNIALLSLMVVLLFTGFIIHDLSHFSAIFLNTILWFVSMLSIILSGIAVLRNLKEL